MMQPLRFSFARHIPQLRHAVTTRAGGVSASEYSHLNLGYHVGDEAARVSENRRLLAAALGYDAQRLTAAQQTHGAHSQIVDESPAGRGAFDHATALPDTDALIVAAPQLPVMILVADCAPLLLVDPARHVLAVVHAGWRGATARIASQTVQRLEREFASDPHDLHVGIGPCLGIDNFEIGPEVAAAAAPIAPEAVRSEYSGRRYVRPHLDLRALLRRDLQSAGVHLSHIETLPQCPAADNAAFFSHRAQNGKAGRFGLVAWWDA